MRRLIGLLVVLAALWCSWWFLVSYGLRQAVVAGIGVEEARGWTVETGPITAKGFPVSHRLRIDGIALLRDNTLIQTDWVALNSPALWPGDQTLRLPPEVNVRMGKAAFVVGVEDPLAHLRFSPALSLPLAEARTATGPWTVTENGTEIFSGGAIDLSVTDAGAPARYNVVLDLPGFTPGSALRQMMRAPDELPPSLEIAHARGEFLFDRPLDRHALGGPPVQPREIVVESADLRWGTLGLSVQGALQMDAIGVPEGALTIDVRNWRQLLNMVRDAGTVPPNLLNAVEKALGVMAMLGGGGGKLTLQLNFKDGIMALGPLPLGPAPLIRL